MIRMTLHQSRYDLRAFLRNRQSQVFTLALPILFLVIFASVFGGRREHHPGPWRPDPHLGVLRARDHGPRGDRGLLRQPGRLGDRAARTRRLKRRRATPVPAAAIIAGRVLVAIVIAVVMAAVLLGIGWAAYGAHVPGRTAGALAVTVVIGAASFCCLGLRAHLADPQRGHRPAGHPGAAAAAVLHLRDLRRGLDPAALARRRRRDLPGPAPGQRAAHRLQPAHHRARLRRPGPADRGRMGRRSPARRPAHVQLAAARTLTRPAAPTTSGGSSWLQKTKPRPADARPTGQSRPHETSPRWDSRSSSTPTCGPGPSASRSSAPNAEKPCRPTERRSTAGL